MRLSTKTLASLLLITAVAESSEVQGTSRAWKKESRFDRLLRRHDRKAELQAGLCGTSPEEFRALQKRTSFEEVVRRHGFLDKRSFRVALFGKIKTELHQRGWSSHKINTYLQTRSKRVI